MVAVAGVKKQTVVKKILLSKLMVGTSQAQLVIRISATKIRKMNSVKFDFEIAISLEENSLPREELESSLSFEQLKTLYSQYRRPLLEGGPHSIDLNAPFAMKLLESLKITYPVLPLLLYESCCGQDDSAIVERERELEEVEEITD
jgi:hypothetical protein